MGKLTDFLLNRAAAGYTALLRTADYTPGEENLLVLLYGTASMTRAEGWVRGLIIRFMDSNQGKYEAERVTHFTHLAERPNVTSTNSRQCSQVVTVGYPVENGAGALSPGRGSFQLIKPTKRGVKNYAR